MLKKYVLNCLRAYGNTVIGNNVIKQYGIKKVEQELTKRLGKEVVIVAEKHRFVEYGRCEGEYAKQTKPTINYIAKVKQ